MKNSKKALAVLCALGAIGASAALVACDDRDTADKGPKYLPNYTFPTANHETDPEITLDGKLDDAVYKNQRWLVVNKALGSETATIKATSYFGEKGVYFAFDVSESGRIYYNPERNSFMNSGIEMYLQTAGTTTINCATSFEVDMQASGILSFKRSRHGGGWEEFHTANENMARLATTVKGGPINTEKSNGYIIELFLPNEYMQHLGLYTNGVRPTEFYMNPVLITSYNYAGTNTGRDRNWYNTVQNDLGFNGWDDVVNNYHFDQYGAKIHNLTINGTGVGGTVTTAKGYDYVVDGSGTTLIVDVKDGYKLTSFKVNDLERRNKLTKDIETGQYTYSIPSVTADVTVDVKFEKVSAQSSTVTGTVAYTGTDSAFLDDIDVIFDDGSNTFTATVNRETGAYNITVPNGDYTVTVMSSSDKYVVAEKAVTVSAAATVDFNVDDTMYGENRTVRLNDAVIFSGKAVLFDNAVSPIRSQQFVFNYFMGLGDESKDLATIPYYVQEVYLYTAEETYARFQFVNWNNSYTYKVIWYENGKEQNTSASLSPVMSTLLKDNGLNYALIRNGNRFAVAVVNENGVWDTLKDNMSLGTTFDNDAPITKIELYGREGLSGTYPTALQNGVIVPNATNPAQLPKLATTADYDATAVTVTGLEPEYAIGETAQFSVTAKPGYVAKVLVNGKNVTTESGNYSVLFRGKLNLQVVSVPDNRQKFSVTVRGNKFGETVNLDGVTATLSGMLDYTATIDNGVLTVNALPGEYELIINGYATKMITLGGGDTEVPLDYRMFADADGWDLSAQNNSDAKITTPSTGSNAWLISSAKYNDVYFETTFKYNHEIAEGQNGNSDRVAQRYGVFFQFENGKTFFACIVTEQARYGGATHVQFSPIPTAASSLNASWESKHILTTAELAEYRSATGIRFGMLRSGKYVVVYLNDQIVARKTLPDEYADMPAQISVGRWTGVGVATEFKLLVDENVSRNISISNASTAVGCTVELENEYNIGDNVRIKVTPNADVAEGSTLMTFVVNGVEHAGDYSDGYVTLTNCADPVLRIVAKWAKPAFAATPMNDQNYDLTRLDEGIIGYNGVADVPSLLSLGNHVDFMIKTKFK